MESSLTVSECPSGQSAGSEDCWRGRLTSKVDPHSRQRNSYSAMRRSVGRLRLAGQRFDGPVSPAGATDFVRSEDGRRVPADSIGDGVEAFLRSPDPRR